MEPWRSEVPLSRVKRRLRTDRQAHRQAGAGIVVCRLVVVVNDDDGEDVVCTTVERYRRGLNAGS